MLTATYTLVALSVEQTTVRVSLQSLQNFLHSNLRHGAVFTPSQLEYAADTVKRLYETCHWRKLDKFLIPALRRATGAADGLLAELDALSRSAADAMTAGLRALDSGAHDTEARIRQFCAAVDNCCSALLKRLEREERELFALASSIISGEVWFSIGKQMLAHDAYRKENHGEAPPEHIGRSYFGRPDRQHRQGPPLSYMH